MFSKNEGQHGFTRRHRGVLTGLLMLAAVAVLALAAGAVAGKAPNSQNDTCGYASNTFVESEVLRDFSPKDSALVGGRVIAYYSDEHALMLGGAGADRSNSATGNADASPNFGAPASDLAGRPLGPVLYISEISDVSQRNAPQPGDWQSGNGVAHTPDAVYGSYKPSTDGKTDPVANGTNLGAASANLSWPSGLGHEGFTTAIVWKLSSLGLDPGKTYKLQFMVHDGDQNHTTGGGDTGEACIAALTPGLTTTATSSTASSPTTAARVGRDTIQDVLHVTNVAQNSNVSVVFKAFAPANSGDVADCNSTAAYTSGPMSRIGPGDVSSAAIIPKKAGEYKWQATVTVDGVAYDLGCGDTSKGSNEVSYVIIPDTPTNTGQKLTVTDRAQISGFASGGGPSTVRFRLYDNSSCSGTPIFEQADVAVDDVNGIATSKEISVQNTGTSDKTFYWVVDFSGNDYNSASTSACGKETFTIHPDGSGVDP